MCFDNNNCSCIWLIVILLLVFCCCGSGTRIPLRLRQRRRRLLLLLRAVHTFARRDAQAFPPYFMPSSRSRSRSMTSRWMSSTERTCPSRAQSMRVHPP